MKVLPTTRVRAFRSALLLIVALLPGLAAAIPAAVEGRIISVTPDVVGGLFGGATINVMGINIYIPANLFALKLDGVTTMVTTPSASITSPSQLYLGNLPGRSDPGFIGGTAIINGDSTGGVFTADDVFVEPAENVVIGVVTRPDNELGCDILLEGVPLVFSEDPAMQDERMPFTTAINGSGFNIDPCSVRAGGVAAVEGYYGDDRNLHIFLMESDDANIRTSGVTTTIARASCDRGKVEVRGSSTLISGKVVVFDDRTEVQLGTADLIYDAVTVSSIYRFRGATDDRGCPEFVRSVSWDGMVMHSKGDPGYSDTVAPVDIK